MLLKCPTIFAFIISFGFRAFAQDSLKVVSDTLAYEPAAKLDILERKFVKTIFEISETQLRRQSWRRFSDILNEVPGIQISGANLSPLSIPRYSIRGTGTGSTLVLIDGIPMNYPTMDNSSYYDLRYLPVDQIKEVLVIEGDGAVLYGSTATAAIISIKLKEAKSEILFGEADMYVGNWGTFSQNVSLNGRQGKTSFVLNANNFRMGEFTEYTDPLDKRNLFLKLGYQVLPKLSIDVFAGYNDVSFDTPYSIEDNTDQLRYGFKGKYNLPNGCIQFSASQIDNTQQNNYEGKNRFGELSYSRKIFPFLGMINGLAFQQLEFTRNLSYYPSQFESVQIEPYSTLFFDSKFGLSVQAGARYLTHSKLDSKLIYNISPSWFFKLGTFSNLRVFSSYSTSFLPSSNPEFYYWFPFEVETLDGGISYSDEKGTSLIISGFIRNRKTQSTQLSYEVKGVTTQLNHSLNYFTKLSGNLTLQKFSVDFTRDWNPEFKLGMAIDINPIPSVNVSIRYDFTDVRSDSDRFGLESSNYFNATRIDPYHVFNLSITKSFRKVFFAYAALDNVYNNSQTYFDRRFNYSTIGRNVSFGLKYNFSNKLGSVTRMFKKKKETKG